MFYNFDFFISHLKLKTGDELEEHSDAMAREVWSFFDEANETLDNFLSRMKPSEKNDSVVWVLLFK